MSQDATHLTWQQVYEMLRQAPPGKLYGVPRGGQIVAGLTGRAVDTPEEADFIVDDIVDSGTTRDRWQKNHPGKSFWALVDKSRPGLPSGWIHFPWEHEPARDAADNVTRLLEFIGENPNRPGLIDTPMRVVRALKDMTVGYKQDPQKILSRVFPDYQDGLVTLDHIEFVSMCEHHMMAFMGHAHIGYIPSKEGGVVGISKLARLVDCFARRLQVQERLTTQIASAIEEALKPVGVAVVVEAKHSCVCARGVGKQSSMMRTSAMLGVFRREPEARAEFMAMIKP